MNKLFKLLFTILIDQRAEEQGGAGAGSGGEGGAGGQGDAPGKAGQGKEAPAGGEGGQGEDGQDAGEQGAGGQGGQGGQGGEGNQGDGGQPKYGKYKTPEELFQAHQELMAKTSKTEGNTAKLRKTLEAAGIKIGQDEQGNVILLPAGEGKKERVKKFNDDHKKKLGLYFGDDPEKGVESANGFLSLMQNYFEDLLEDQFSTREEQYNQRNSQKTRFIQTQQTSNARMMKMFPQLSIETKGKEGSVFNESFYDRATEIWQESYATDPRGELLAALDAADELGIVPQMIKQAKAEGVKVGQAGKKLLGSADGGQGKGGGGKVITKAEYLALSGDKREEYDRQQLQLQK